MRKYPIKSSDGNIYNMLHIGVNHTIGNIHIGGNASSFNGIFDNLDEVNMESGLDDIRYCVIGDVKEAYEILKNVIKEEKPATFMEYAYCIQKTILKYFGDYSNIGERLSFFPDEDEIRDGKKHGKVSDIAHKNAAMCIERAMLAQNLLKELGFDSTFKASGFKNNGKDDAHAYNLVRVDDKNYIFDVTIPTTYDDRISPVICEIPDEVYEKIANPSSYIGESVHVIHYNPLQDKEYDVIYDAGRNDVYEVTSFTK